MLEQMGQAAKQAAYQLAQCSTEAKNRALLTIATLLIARQETILAANQQDINLAIENGVSEALQDRLRLTPDRLVAMADDVRQVAQLVDPIGKLIDGSTLASGLHLQRKRVPLGVIGVIYEARPNVTIDVAALCLKTGNAAILRGGKETVQTNLELVKVIQSALTEAGLPNQAVQVIDNPDRHYVTALLKLDSYVDLIIPRGGAALHKLCKEQATVPVITGGIGICHTFVDESADFDKVLPIIVNAKTQRPSTCNTTETLLVHHSIAAPFLAKLSTVMAEYQVTLHADTTAYPLLKSGVAKLLPLNEAELFAEWLTLDLNVVIVDSLDKAIDHIRRYSSQHSDAILTQSLVNAQRFVDLVDSAAVYVNASTRFTDGAQFGLGAEVAVSTQKLHARGPMGLDALTTYKWIGIGDNLSRK